MVSRLTISDGNRWKVAIAVLVVCLFALLAFIAAFSTVTVAGTVDHKTIVGVNDQTQDVLVVMGPWGITVNDPCLSALFADVDQNAVINESLEWEMICCGYSEIRYVASIRVSSQDPVNNVEPGGTLAYYVKRHDFNSLMIGQEFTFEVAKSEHATVTKVHV
jgi:hypothetical protein